MNIRQTGEPQATSLAGGLEVFVAGGVDFILPAGEAVCRGDVTDGAIQALGIVVVDEVAGDAVGVFKGQRGFGTDGLLFERLVEAFEFSVGLGILGTGRDVAGLPLGDEGFELPAFEPGSLTADAAGPRLRVHFTGFLDDDFGIDLPHGGTDVPCQDGARTTVEHATQEVEGAADIQIGKVGMPVLVRGQGLDEAGAFLRGLAFGAADQSGLFEHTIRRRRSHGGHVRIHHHEGQAAVAFQRVVEGITDDGLLFLWLQPVIARHLRVVLIGLAVASAPPAKLPGAEFQPRQEAGKGEFGEGVHAFEEVHHGIAFVRVSHCSFSPPQVFLCAPAPRSPQR